MQKRALKCIYHGNEFAAILCLTNLPGLKEILDSVCKKIFPKNNGNHTPAKLPPSLSEMQHVWCSKIQ